MKEIRIKYFDKNMPKLEKIKVGDWIDLRVSKVNDKNCKIPFDMIKFNQGDTKHYDYKAFSEIQIYLGIGMILPAGYEANILPRGSLFKNTGLILTNSMGIVDNSYNGDNDEWLTPIFSLLDGSILKYQRLFQFRIVPNMEKIKFKEVLQLNEVSRGRQGSTGVL